VEKEMKFRQAISLCALGIATGIATWVTVSAILALLTNSITIGGGFLSGTSGFDLMQIMKRGLIIGAIHGLVVCAGISLIAADDSFAKRVVAGFIASEIALIAFQIYAFSFLFIEWRSTTVAGSVENTIVYFILFSVVLFLPTVLIVLSLTTFNKLISATL
jgi:hypothetical protein